MMMMMMMMMMASKKVSLIKTALNRCLKAEMRCQRKDVSRRSPDVAAVRRIGHPRRSERLTLKWHRESQTPAAKRCRWLEG